MWKQNCFYKKYQNIKKNYVTQEDIFPLVIIDTFDMTARFSGTKKPGETLSKFKSISSKAYYICLITHWIGIIFAFFDSRDFARIGEITILVTAIALIIIFSLCYTCNGHSIYRIINEIIELNRRERNNEQFVSNLFVNYVQDVTLFFLCLAFGWTLSSSFFITPFVKQELILPMRSKLSYFTHNSHIFYYALAYIYQCFVIGSMVHMVVLTGHCAGGIVKMISLHFQCLADKFRMLNNGGSNFYLHDLIKQHQHLLRLMDDYHKVFGFVLVSQIFTSMFLMCWCLFAVFVAMDAGRNEALLSFTAFWVCSVVQFFYWCWLGNNIRYQSYDIANAALSSNWKSMNNRMKKDLIMIVVRAQKPTLLKADPFFILNYATFVSVLKTSYSTFTMLTSFHSDTE